MILGCLGLFGAFAGLLRSPTRTLDNFNWPTTNLKQHRTTHNTQTNVGTPSPQPQKDAPRVYLGDTREIPRDIPRLFPGAILGRFCLDST